MAGSVLCIGLDVAWFGGSAGDRDSQHDCLAWTLLDRRAGRPLTILSHLERIALQKRDPDASQLLRAIESLLETHRSVDRVVFAIDAPVQALPRPHLPARAGSAPSGTIEWRACENHLNYHRKRIDSQAVGGAGDWYPNIQPGAPLAPRVLNLLAGLARLGFRLWTDADRTATRLVIECFPAEAIWTMRRLDRYAAALTGTQVKCYKGLEGTLAAQRVTTLVHTVLDGFAADSGNAGVWNLLVEHALDWLLADAAWRTAPDQYRGGKLLDDVVDSMICLATAMSYVHGQFHVWQDPGQPADGHIIGPGRLEHLPGATSGLAQTKSPAASQSPGGA